MISFVLATVVKIVIVFNILLLVVAYMTYVERKILGRIQVRLGPMRVGFHGLLQPIADGIKLMFKEDVIPREANRWVFVAAPIMTLIPAIASFAIIPFGDSVSVLGVSVDLVIADVNVGILYFFALSSLGVLGFVMAGWSSNSKYSLLGGLRGSAQMISYELTLGLSVVGVIMLTGSLSLVDIVDAQAKVPFILLQPLGFALFMVAGVAEVNRAPFDLPEAETELVAGYHTEYSSMKFAMFFMGEYAAMITISALASTLFLGGWRGPLLPPVVWFLVKMFFFLFVFIWLRATFPRLRYDQLMDYGWKVLLPLALANIVITAGALAFWG
ncbi:MAG: NADH-quinone oxidoreductase subunit NuoH [Nitrospinota bacterium]|nr:NADH-quinone oxidoreductase subunit NuoH [Nitrospinota bacterium]